MGNINIALLAAAIWAAWMGSSWYGNREKRPTELRKQLVLDAVIATVMTAVVISVVAYKGLA